MSETTPTISLLYFAKSARALIKLSIGKAHKYGHKIKRKIEYKNK